MIEFILGIYVGIGLTWLALALAMREKPSYSTEGAMAI